MFDSEKGVSSCEEAVKLIIEVEVPTCLNLAHCYNQTHNYHFAIKYASQVLDQDDSSTRALFRRGSAYSEIGEFERARADLELALSFVKQTDEKVALLEALDRLRDLEN